jgi:predicted acetyltransferase
VRTAFAILLFFTSRLCAQTDSIPYSKDFNFKEGLYLSYADFRNNDPIPKTKIQTNYDKNALDFFKQETAKTEIKYLDASGVEQTVRTNKLWGYCSNNGIYINYGRDFSKIMVVGSICHFTATVETYVGGYDHYTGAPANIRSYQLEQFVIDSRTGKVGSFTLVNMEALLKQDDALYNEFMKLSKRKRKDMMFVYLRKFNEKYPLYFKS